MKEEEKENQLNNRLTRTRTMPQTKKKPEIR
jgi:hypothetical protein